ncbi:hypothetical protein NDU88_007667 [Pleurodeles waltl]|uniref:Uncharacterized protein n=1 Tax=Pleurodeles waltl TaxID=8319 RepID=A0AAV7U4D4_PLEWA|nr:hypothetical protein NDU88_007667 [Pleurodeles waltl]
MYAARTLRHIRGGDTLVFWEYHWVKHWLQGVDILAVADSIRGKDGVSQEAKNSFHSHKAPFIHIILSTSFLWGNKNVHSRLLPKRLEVAVKRSAPPSHLLASTESRAIKSSCPEPTFTAGLRGTGITHRCCPRRWQGSMNGARRWKPALGSPGDEAAGARSRCARARSINPPPVQGSGQTEEKSLLIHLCKRLQGQAVGMGAISLKLRGVTFIS